MHKTPAAQEKQGELLSVITALDATALQGILLARVKQAALSMAVALLEQDAEAPCGARYARQGARLCHRGGSEPTSVVLEGARYAVWRPRVHNRQGEVALPTLAKRPDHNLLDEPRQHRMLLGVSPRNYDKVVDGYAEKLGISRSAVSRAFIRASQQDLDSLNEGELRDRTFVALMIDGWAIGGRSVGAALGIRAEMEKVPLGWRESDTENSEVVRDLLASRQDRCFTLHCERPLAVINGAKALKKALRQGFGERVCIQRCWRHKLRNLRASLPERVQGTRHWRLKKLMTLTSLDEARKELASLRAGLATAAAASREEVGKELLPLPSLGITGELRKSLASTTLIESLFCVVREKLHRVKNWQARRSHHALR